MERRTLIGGLLLSSGIVGVRYPVAARGWRDSEANEEAMWRLQNAHEFFPAAEFERPADLLYQLGIVSQLALTACLVATGWSDEDCRSNVGQDVGKAFFLANAGGLQFHSESFARLMPLLSPYGRWRPPAAVAWRELGTIDTNEVRLTVSRLLAAVRSHLADADAKGARQ
jgi:hypothetical protein